MTAPSLSILIVSYNTLVLTRACLRSIDRYPPLGDFEVIVVDNDSRDGSIEMVREEFPWVHLISTGENLGFARGNNLAMEKARHEIFVLLNSDTEVHEGALPALQEFLAENAQAAMVGGFHYFTDGSVQPSIKYFPRLSSIFCEALFLHRLVPGPFGTEHETRKDRYHAVREAEWLSGSYLAVRREWYEKVGGFDPGFFMYSEDSDWCYRIHQAGGKLYYCPDSVITHHGGGSSTGISSLSVTLVLSRDRYARLHFPAWKASLYRFGLALGLLVRGVLLVGIAPFRKGGFKSVRQRFSALAELFARPLPL